VAEADFSVVSCGTAPPSRRRLRPYPPRRGRAHLGRVRAAPVAQGENAPARQNDTVVVLAYDDPELTAQTGGRGLMAGSDAARDAADADTGMVTSGEAARAAQALSERDREILGFERQWWKYAGAKEHAIREKFDMSATRYYQVLNALIDTEAA